MNQTTVTGRKIMLLSFVTAGTTVIAGIYHLTMVSQSISHDPGRGMLFLVGGILQVFWAIPVIKQWGRIWQIIGIVGTAILFILWFVTHMPGGVQPGNIPQGEFPRNLTGEGFPRGPPPGGMGIGLGGFIPPIEMFQIAFIGLYVLLGKMISKKQKKDRQETRS